MNMKNRLKGFAKEILKKHPTYKAKDIIRKIAKYDIVSFDIFDTLVNRDVSSPQEVFALVARDCLCDEEDVIKFRECRIEAEKKARELEKDKEDVDLDKIYACIDDRYKSFASSFKEAEVKWEIELAYPNPVIKQVYDWCRQKKKKMMFISDMYLDKNTVSEILRKCGYLNGEKIYISSEQGLLKTTGNLFKYVKRDMYIDDQKWIHIGDSLRGDYIGAKKNNIEAIRIATNPSRTLLIKQKKPEVWAEIDTILSGHLNGDESYFYRFGFEILSPFLCSFCFWLHKKAKEKNIEKLFFLARDGYLLQEVYKSLYEGEALPNAYLYVSRRALRLPILYTCDGLEDFASLFPKNKYLSMTEVFELFGLDDEVEAWLKAGFKEKEHYFSNTLINDEKFRHFYNDIEEKYRQKSKKAFNDYICYLKENDFTGNIGIVDIGWAGTIQRCLNKIIPQMDNDIKLSAFYVGLTRDAESSIEGVGYIPSHYKPQVATAGLFEYPFLKQEGSLKKIEKINGDIVVVVSDYEYEYDENNKVCIKEMQRGALEGVKILKKNVKLWEHISVDEAYIMLLKLTKKPSLKEATIFGEINFYDGVSCPLAKPKNIWQYILNYRLFLKDFSDSGWKVGFLRRMLKIPFPYAKVLEVAKK